MSESTFDQLAKPNILLLLMIFIVSLLCYHRHLYLQRIKHQCQISYEKIEQLEQKIGALEGMQERNVDLPMHLMQLEDAANEVEQEFWKKKDLFPLFVQFLDGEQRNKLCQVNKYFSQFGEDTLNQLCLQQRSALRYLKFLEIFKIPFHCRYTHKKIIENKNAILKHNKIIDFFLESEEKVLHKTGYVLSNVHHTIEIPHALREYIDDPNNRAINDLDKPVRLVLKSKTIKVEFEQNDGVRAIFLTLEKRNDNCKICKFDQIFWEIDNCEKVAIAFDPKENAIVFFDIEHNTILHDHHFPDVTAILTKPSRMYIDMPPGNYDFYFDEWPEEWKLNYEMFKDIEDL